MLQLRRVALLLLIPLLAWSQFLDQGKVSLQGNRIAAIRVEGNRGVSEELIRGRMQVKEGEEIHPAVLPDKVRESIRSLYESGLFADVQVAADYQGASGDLVLVVQVVEQTSLGEVLIDGNDAVTEEDLKALVTLVEGQVFGTPEVERIRGAMLRKYRETH